MHWTRMMKATLLVIAAMLATGARAADLHIAVAANFAPTLAPLVAAFEKGETARVLVSSGSTGKLYAQIARGAPYDVFLAADKERPQRLEAEGMAVQGTRFTYGRGELVLWSRNRERIDADGAVLRAGRFRHLALANPKTAPYGIAARETLKNLGLWQELQPRLVFGEDIGQAFQFVHTGNAELGFVALAQVRRLAPESRGSYWRVPGTLYSPIEQQAVLLKRAAGNAVARRFLEFLKGDTARRIIGADGYGLP